MSRSTCVSRTKCVSIVSTLGLLLAVLPGPAQAAPTSAKQARQAVVGWLKTDASPLGAALGQPGDPAAYTDVAGAVAYYVVPLAPEGFVVVSAEDWVEPIIAFSATGTFDPSPAGPLGALLGRDMPARVQAARNLQAQNATPADADAPAKWADLVEMADATITTGLANVSDVWVAPFLASKWDQEQECGANCYNYYTPNNYVTGCVATALAQLLRHYQLPTTGIGVRQYTVEVDGVAQTAYTRGGNGSGGAYNWAQMPLDPDCTLTTTQRQAIGALVYDCATTVSMSYTATGSGADVFKAVDALLAVFGYTNGIKGYNSGGNLGSILNTMINPNIDAGYPTILGISGPYGGHAVIPDGYGYNASTLYHHLNMGWGGYDNAWYNLPTIDAYYLFNVVDVALYNIYTTGTGEIISGRVTDMGGNPLGGATVTATRTGGGVYTDTTDSYGVYALAKVPGSSSFSVTAAKSGYQFALQNVTTGASSHWGTNCGNRWGVNFAATNGQPPQASAAGVSTDFNVPLTITLQASDDGVPNPPGAMTYIIKTLPAHGALTVPGGSNITTVPFSLPAGVNQVAYTPATNYSGADSFGFAATDGGTPPNGGESNTATISITVTACTATTIGTGTVNWNYPMHTYYHDGRVQSIYLASEVGAAGSITSLALNVVSAPNIDLNAWTIRMKHTTQSTYASAYFESAGWTVVYQANEPAGTTGWRTFTFTTPFNYNGTSNLMIDFSHNNSDFGNYGLCAATNVGAYRSVYGESDSLRGDPLTWLGTTNNGRSNNRPNVRLTMCASGGPPTAPAGLSYSTKGSDSITWSWTDTANNEDGFRARDASQTVVWTAAANAANHEETSLLPNTQYTRTLYAYNGSGESGPSNTASVYTLPLDPNVTCNRQAGCPAYAVGTGFTFTNHALIGPGGIAYYRYVWDRNAGYSFSGSEASWNSGTLPLAGSQTGAWYLHLASYNAENATGNVVHLGPYLVATTVGYTPGDLDHDCDVDQADLELFIACAQGPGVVQTLPGCSEALLDGDNDVDSADFGIFQRCWSGSGTPADPACRD